MSNTPVKCVGLLGRLFGHKFIKVSCGWQYRSNHCFRCGFGVSV